MKRIIVDYSKLTNEILTLLVERFPDGYDDSNIIRFKNAQNELVEAVEVRTDDTIYLVKVSTKLADRIVNFDEDDDIVVPLEAIKGIHLEDEDQEVEDEEEEEKIDQPEFDDEDEDDSPSSDIDEESDEDED